MESILGILESSWNQRIFNGEDGSPRLDGESVAGVREPMGGCAPHTLARFAMIRRRATRGAPARHRTAGGATSGPQGSGVRL